MPQILFGNQTGLPFKSFCVDFLSEDKKYITWDLLFNTVYEKYKINKEILYFKNKNGHRVYYKRRKKEPLLNIKDFCFYTLSGKPLDNYLFNFGIFVQTGLKLK